jgi:AcrR family transcriptional regulator
VESVVEELEDAIVVRARARRPRSDAARNRAALLAAAEELYADQGIDVSLEEIARSAGVGIATLYRHFPRGKEQLVCEALVGQVTRYVDAARRALAASDPWKGFVSFVEEICAMQEGDLGFSDVLATVLPADERVEELRREANDLVIELIDRAKAAGKLRADFVGEDLLLLLIANAAVLNVTRRDAPSSSRRLAAFFLDAVSMRRSRAPLPDPPSSEQMLRAMTRLATARGCGPEPVVARGEPAEAVMPRDGEVRRLAVDRPGGMR